MKPFDLSDALQGKPVVLEDGTSAHGVIFHDGLNNPYAVTAVSNGLIHQYTHRGAPMKEGNPPLMMKSETIVRWVATHPKTHAAFGDTADSREELEELLVHDAHAPDVVWNLSEIAIQA